MGTELVRLTVLVETEIRAALRAEATERGVDMGDLVTELVKQHFAETLGRVRQHRAAGDKKKGGKP